MSDIDLVGICGFARSGKDAAAQALTGLDWVRFAFADALKDDVSKALNGSLRAVTKIDPMKFSGAFDMTSTEVKKRFRKLLVDYGAAMRTIHPDYWILRLETSLRFTTPGLRRVVTDVRYRNEAEWVRMRGGVVIRIVRPTTAPANEEEAVSVPEIEPDAVIRNVGSLADLCAEMLKTVSRLNEKRRMTNG